MLGKLDPDALRDFLDAPIADDSTVLQGPAYGEDAAAIDVGGTTLVVSADPLSLASEGAARLAIHVGCNDVAVCGAEPRWLTDVVFLPDDDPGTREAVASGLGEAAADLGLSIVGGHAEYLPALDRPLLSVTVLGTTDRYVSTGGAAPGDRVLLTKAAGVEASAILATDFREELLDAGIDATTVDAAAEFFDDVSVLRDARALREYATAMHDPTEGGVLEGLVELARASGRRITVDREDVPVRPETRTCCDALGVDPLATFGSGAVLATVPESRVGEALDAAADADLEVAVIGEVQEVDGCGSGAGPDGDAGTADAGLAIDGDVLAEPPRDELYPLWE